MSNTVIQELGEFGQSIWLDHISRSLIEKGGLKELIDKGLLGMTSNPTIFDKAVSSSSDYDSKISSLAESGKSTFEIYDEITVGDVQDAADMLLEVYESTNGKDGYVSLEINPKLAMDTAQTIEEGKRLHEKVNRPNLMLKVPATDPGFEAIEELVSEGMNINVTLIFSKEQYIKTVEAYINGIIRLSEKCKDLSHVNSVASVFVSRIDTLVDKILDKKIEVVKDELEKEKLEGLKGRAAVANSELIYSKYLAISSSDRFLDLMSKGARLQRVLWGSTSTKNPEYSDIKYITELIGKNTVNTVPSKTLDAFLDHGTVEEALTGESSEAKSIIDNLDGCGVSVDEVCARLLQEGVDAFVDSFESLLSSIESKAKDVCAK